MMFQKLVLHDGILEVTEISEKQESKGRPSGLNTVNLLKVRKIWALGKEPCSWQVMGMACLVAWFGSFICVFVSSIFASEA